VDIESTEIAVVGGGQAGLALSYHLTDLGRPHVILEQGRTVESWRSRRWDSLRLIAPNWSLVMPGFAYAGDDPDGYMGKDEVVERLVAYARSFGAPVREGVRVVSIERDATGTKFVLHTPRGQMQATQVVIASGALQRPRVPTFAAAIPTGIAQLTGFEYRSPRALAREGSVLVVGSGETGCQIAEELAGAGREVILSGGRSWWAPRRYRGRDIAAWLRLTGWFERTAADLPPGVRAGQPNPQLTGADGGHDISAYTLAREGVRLHGRLVDIQDGVAYFAADLAANLAWGDEQALALLERIDRLVDQEAIDAPAARRPADLVGATRKRVALISDAADSSGGHRDLVKGRVGTVIWATGYRPDLGWVRLPFLDADGYPIQRRGVTAVDGLYVLGLDWLHTAKSGLFAGISEDAGYVASVIDRRATAQR
jgi:putative flavoprotein involved in K+ transport